ncbi:MAG: transglycosylase domain-containing protein [Oscillospiraceae bacterium]|nr:transglycosylase domain-containing protein [Oscillospiraceae bacterium]
MEQKEKGDASDMSEEKDKIGRYVSEIDEKLDSIQKEEKPVRGHRRKKMNRGLRAVLRVLLVFVCVVMVIGVLVSAALAFYLMDVTKDDDTLLDLNSLKLSYSTILMAQNKKTGEWEEYERIYGDENRVWVDYDDMPQCLIDATVASEDQRFWSHRGVDWKRTLAAFVNEYVFRLYSNTQGGSTITQQLVKNITDEKEVGGMGGVLRKVREIYRAVQLEKNYSKEQIMEAYLNTIRLSGQLAGIESAANYFFGETTSQLTAAQSAAIVCITKYPTKYDPIQNPEENKHQREDVVLWLMNQYGLLDDAGYKAALAESATMTFTKGNTSANDQVYSYFTDTVIRKVIGDLQKYNGMTYDEASDLFYKGGLTVYLTVDTDVQDTVERVAADRTLWGEPAVDADGKELANQLQGAMVVMNYKGEIVGIAGGVRGKTESLVLNRAVGSITFNGDGTYKQDGTLRQTGSSMKPLSAYAPALEINAITYSSAFKDDAFEHDNNGNPWPRNYSGAYGAEGVYLTVYEGIRASYNTIAARVLDKIGYNYAFDFVETRLGITTLVDTTDQLYDYTTGKRMMDRTLSLALGGLTFGCSVEEMCAAYCVFGSGGTYITPHCYTKVVNARGEVILDTGKTNQTIKALSDDTAMIMNKLLQGVAYQGTGYAFTPSGKLPYAGKSGTTSDAKDYWYIGMNPYYVTASWQGYDQPQYMPMSERKYAGAAFKQVMAAISADLAYKTFPTSDNVIALSFCKQTGLLAGPACTEVLTGWYKRGVYPDVCDHAAEMAKWAEESGNMYS